MKRRVRILRRAERDLQEIFDYVAREGGLAADQFIDRLLDAIQSLEHHATRGAQPRDRVLRERGYRYLVHRGWLVFYKMGARSVRIYRVLRGRREYRGLL